jgi:predicted SAM-dependent methyltransferase
LQRLNVGCGMTPTEGYRNFDNSHSVRLARYPRIVWALRRGRLCDDEQYAFIKFCREHTIEYADVRSGLPIESSTTDVFYSSHVLEHLDAADAELLLHEARRVLRTGGILRLAVPDLRLQVNEYLRCGDADRFVGEMLLAGRRPRGISAIVRSLVVGSRDHMWMYDGRSLCQLLTRSGWSNAEVCQPGATRISDPGCLDLEERGESSVFVEVTKD